MASLIQLCKYAAINASYPTTTGYCVLKYLSKPSTLQEDQTTYCQVSKSGEPVVKSEHFILMKSKTNWYCEQHGKHWSFIISTPTIVHPCLEVSVIKNVSDIPRSICNKNHDRLRLDKQCLLLIQIMIILQTKLSEVIISIMKYKYTMMINEQCI